MAAERSSALEPCTLWTSDCGPSLTSLLGYIPLRSAAVKIAEGRGRSGKTGSPHAPGVVGLRALGLPRRAGGRPATRPAIAVQLNSTQLNSTGMQAPPARPLGRRPGAPPHTTLCLSGPWHPRWAEWTPASSDPTPCRVAAIRARSQKEARALTKTRQLSAGCYCTTALPCSCLRAQGSWPTVRQSSTSSHHPVIKLPRPAPSYVPSWSPPSPPQACRPKRVTGTGRAMILGPELCAVLSSPVYYRKRLHRTESSRPR